MVTPQKMQAARLYDVDSDMQIEEIAVPDIRPDEVLIKVQACNVVQNLKNVLKGMDDGPISFPFPQLPAVFGLDVTGTVERCGSLTSGFEVGDRVYVNPGLSCGGCKACRSDRSIDCEAFALRGYFGIGPKSQKSLDDYPQGGFAQFMTAPQRNLVRLPDGLDFDTASRFGYLGTAFSALQQAGCGPDKTVLIDGITGTLGLGAVAIAVAMGAAKILGTARDTKLFSRVKALGADGQIEILELGTADTKEWALAQTDGDGVDIVIDALGNGAPPEALQSVLSTLQRGGYLVNIGATTGDVPIAMFWALSNNIKIIGSSWFTTGQGQQMAALVERGLLDLSFFENQKYPLSAVNDAIDGTGERSGGFTNFVVNPN